MIPIESRVRAISPGLPACMGGWCRHRDHCHRHLTERRAIVVERLCTRGMETPEPVSVLQHVEADMAGGAL